MIRSKITILLAMLALSVSTMYAENNGQKRGKSFFSLDIGGGYGKMWGKYLLVSEEAQHH